MWRAPLCTFLVMCTCLGYLRSAALGHKQEEEGSRGLNQPKP